MAGVQAGQAPLRIIAAICAMLILPAILIEPLLPLMVALGPLAQRPVYLAALFSGPLLLAITALAAHLCARRPPRRLHYLAVAPLLPVVWAWSVLIAGSI